MRLLRASLAAVRHKTMSPRPRDPAMLGVGVRLDAVLEAGQAVLRAGNRRGACGRARRRELRGGTQERQSSRGGDMRVDVGQAEDGGSDGEVGWGGWRLWSAARLDLPPAEARTEGVAPTPKWRAQSISVVSEPLRSNKAGSELAGSRRAHAPGGGFTLPPESRFSVHHRAIRALAALTHCLPTAQLHLPRPSSASRRNPLPRPAPPPPAPHPRSLATRHRIATL